MQPDSVLSFKNDGTIEGDVIYRADDGLVSRFPKMKDPHPKESRCQVYNQEVTYKTNGIVEMRCSYFGLIGAKTTGVISYTPNQDRDAVETHPDFTSFAGTKSSPKNGAKFDPDTGEFLGFFDPTVKGLFGARYYLVPSTLVSLTYWQNSVPSIRNRMKIVSSIPGFRKPSDVKNFLLLDFPYRQLGDYYQVTEQYLGSGPDGWSTKLYK